MSAWEEVVDESGRTYYYNTETQETTWDKPDELSSELDIVLKTSSWERYTTAEGEVYFYNAETKESSWEVPEEIKLQLASSATPELEQLELNGEGDDLDIEELELKYPNHSQIINKKQINSITPKQLEQAKSSFIEMLEEGEVDSSWSFNKVMEVFIRDPRYWGTPDSLMKKELFEGYLINKSEEEYKKSLNSKELFKSNFIKVLENYNVKYYTRWKTISNQLVDEPIYALASEKLKIEIFNEYVKSLRTEHDKKQQEERKQALIELEDYFMKELKLTMESNFEELLKNLKNDQRFKDNKHFEVLSKLDLLTVYDSVIKKTELEFSQMVKYQRRKIYSEDKKYRAQFKTYLNNLSIRVTPRTTWFEFCSSIKNSQEFENLIGRSGSSPIDYFWDLLNSSQQFLNLQKNLIQSQLLELKIDQETISNIADFKKILKQNKLSNELNEDELSYIFDKITNDNNSQERTPRTSRRDSRDLSPNSLSKINLNTYRTKRDETTKLLLPLQINLKNDKIDNGGELDY